MNAVRFKPLRISAVTEIIYAGTRKLRCTGEPAGCARCGEEGISCVYAARKRMGRPRKRRRWEDDGARVEGLSDDFGAIGGGGARRDVVLQPLSPHVSGGVSPPDELLMGNFLSNFPIH